MIEYESVALIDSQLVRETRTTRRKTNPNVALPTTDLTCIAFGLNPKPRSKIPATDCLTCVAQTQGESSSCLRG
jgi:hypothetical protein